MAGFDVNKLSTGDQVIGVSGVALFIFSFFSWLGAKVDLGSGREASDAKSGWGFTLTLIAILIGIALVAYVALKASDVKLPELGSITWAQLVLGLAAVAFLFVLIKLIAGPHLESGLSDVGVEKTRKIGIFLGLIATGGLVGGAYLNFQAERAGGGSRPTPPPPPGPPTA